MHPDVLDWLLFLNTHDEFTYHYAYGDKDTFRAAFALAGKAEGYYLVGRGDWLQMCTKFVICTKFVLNIY